MKSLLECDPIIHTGLSAKFAIGGRQYRSRVHPKIRSCRRKDRSGPRLPVSAHYGGQS